MRRAARSVLFALVALPAIAGAGTEEWRFEVKLDDKPIGTHRFSLSDRGPERVLVTEASFDVKILFITAFKYRHENVETWRDGCLTSLSARTDSNGKLLEVEGESRDGRFAVTRSGGTEELGDCVQSFAYWNPAILTADRLLNSQTGEYERVSVSASSDDRLEVDGTAVAAKRYTLSAAGGDITLWYGRDDGRWLGLEAPAKGGRRIRYEAVELPADSERDVVVARND